jgi:hypothetical protein
LDKSRERFSLTVLDFCSGFLTVVERDSVVVGTYCVICKHIMFGKTFSYDLCCAPNLET